MLVQSNDTFSRNGRKVFDSRKMLPSSSCFPANYCVKLLIASQRLSIGLSLNWSCANCFLFKTDGIFRRKRIRMLPPFWENFYWMFYVLIVTPLCTIGQIAPGIEYENFADIQSFYQYQTTRPLQYVSIDILQPFGITAKNEMPFINEKRIIKNDVGCDSYLIFLLVYNRGSVWKWLIPVVVLELVLLSRKGQHDEKTFPRFAELL